LSLSIAYSLYPHLTIPLLLFIDEELSPEFLQKYQIDFSQILGKGAYGVVRKGVSKLTKDEVAIKIYDLRNMSPRAQEAISREVEILTELDNPNIVKALDCHKVR
jgi:predicted Ser/Thr protein kinase